MDNNNVRYVVNRERGVVVCILENCGSIVGKRLSRYDMDWMVPYSKIKIPDRFVGKAQCSPEDTFDEIYGKQIALTRAKIARKRAINAALDDCFAYIENKLDVAKKYCYSR